MTQMLTSEQAARLLGITRATLYSYVSRGYLSSTRAADGQPSRFRIDEVERLAKNGRPRRRPDSRVITTSMTTSITRLDEHELSYRGRRVVELMGTFTFEPVAEMLWQSGLEQSAAAWRPDMDTVRWMDGVVRPEDSANDRLILAVTRLGANDPMRFSTKPVHVAAAGRSMIATAVSISGPPLRPVDPLPSPTSAAETLCRALDASGRGAAPAGERVGVARMVEAIMIALADHELAASTLAARVAASTRADPYACVLAALATMRGPFHGGASNAVHEMLTPAIESGLGEQATEAELRGWAAGLLSRYSERSQRLPGFGHSVYKDRDPRYVRLHELMDRTEPFDHPARLLAVLERVGRDHLDLAPNVDMAIGAIAAAAGFTVDAGQTIATIARIAGWTAHVIEEYGERPLRYRTRGAYLE